MIYAKKKNANEENFINLLEKSRGLLVSEIKKDIKKPEDEDKKEQYLRDKYPGLFPPKKFTPEK